MKPPIPLERDHVAVVGGFRKAKVHMDNRDLLDAPWITLGRSPVSPGAHSLSGAIIDQIKPHLSGVGQRPIGAKSLPSFQADTGAILAGLLRPSTGVVSAQRGHSSGVWKDKQPVGYDRFWRLIGAMEAAGFVGVREGTRSNARHQADGYSTRVWPTTNLITEAAAHGVTADTRKEDWSLDVTKVAKPLRRSKGIVVAPFRGIPMGHIDAGVRAAMEGALQDLNDLNASVVIKGAGESATLYRKFIHSLDFGGRHYGPVYLNVSEEERLAITFDGEPAAEVDVKAAQLTLLCGLAGVAAPDGQLPWEDPYALPGIPRAAVKAWTVRSLGRGTTAGPSMRWKPGDAPQVRGVRPKDVRAAMVARYPFIGDLSAFVPQGLLETFEDPKERNVQVGQWVTAREAGIIAAAMAYCVARGCPVLPVHDSLIVPLSRVRDAEEAISGAYFALAGVVPRLEVARAPQNAIRGQTAAT